MKSLARSSIFPLIAVLALAVPLSGCTLMMFATAPIVAEGMWRDWKKKTLVEIEHEAKGEAPPKYWRSTWRNYWNYYLNIGRVEGRYADERSQKWADFVITERRARGLPEL